MALVVPIDGGYLSVRLKPSSAYFRVVRDLYTELLNIERAAGEAIGSLGFASYDEFMRIALAAGISGHREAQRAFAASGHEPEAVTADLAPTLGSCAAVEHGLDDLFSRVDRLLATIKQLGTAATYVLGLAGLSQECTDNVDAMAAQLRELSASLGETAFSVTAAKLQIEMTSCFIRELSHERLAEPDATADARLRGDLRTLTESLMASTATSSRRCRGPRRRFRASSACSTNSRPTCGGCRACTSSVPSRPWASPRPACSVNGRPSMPVAPRSPSAPWPSGRPERAAVRRTLRHHDPARHGRRGAALLIP